VVVLFVVLALGALRRAIIIAGVLRSEPEGPSIFLVVELVVILAAACAAIATVVSPSFVKWGGIIYAASWIVLGVVDTARRRWEVRPE